MESTSINSNKKHLVARKEALQSGLNGNSFPDEDSKVLLSVVPKDQLEDHSLRSQSLRRATIFSERGLEDLELTFGHKRLNFLDNWGGLLLQMGIFFTVVSSGEVETNEWW